MTKVVSLYGASGIGKSTCASGLFTEMKLKGIHCELVQEFVKSWAWADRKVGKFDQPLLFGEQTQREAILYGKVDYVITDSPLHLYGFYEQKYLNKSIVGKMIQPYIDFVKEEGGVEHLNFFLERQKKYDPRGRYETEQESNKNHEELREYLIKNNVEFIVINATDRERVDVILNKLGL